MSRRGDRSKTAATTGDFSSLAAVPPRGNRRLVISMDGAKFRAVSIMVKDRDSRASLVQAFNSWVERARPVAIVHVHYFHDPGAHTRGYQVIYEGSAISNNTPASVKGNGHHRDPVPEAGA